MNFLDEVNSKSVILKTINNQSFYSEVYRKLINLLSEFENSTIRLSGFHIPTEHSMNHPWNLYACKGENCHLGKTDMPRYHYIDKSGNVYSFDKSFYE